MHGFAFGCFHRTRAGRHDAKTGGQHEPFLGSRNCNINAPFIHAKVHRPDRAHAVDIEHRGMVCSVHRPTRRSNIRLHPCRRFILGRQNSLDFMIYISCKNLFEFLDRHARTPFAVDHLHVQTKPGAHVNPQM